MKRLLLLLAACKPPEMDHGKAKTLFDEIQIDTPPGISDLMLDEHGHLWGIAERDRTVVEIELDIAANRASVRAHPLDAIPSGVDTEALTWLAPGRFAIGTEGAHAPTAAVMFATMTEGHLVAQSTRELTDKELGVELIVNHGVEALCGKGDDLWVAIETVGTAAGKRYAPIAHLHGGQLTVSRLWLTSATGKISAMTCDDHGEAYAIERHYEVSRILKLQLGDGDITPTIEHDLGPVLKNSLNLEGIALVDGHLVVVNDNQGNRAEGPTELLVFH